MKVLHIFNEINFSGAEIMYANAAPYFKNKGVKMFAFSTGANMGNFVEEFRNNDIEVYHHFIKSDFHLSGSTFRFYSDFYKFLKKNKIDVVHIHRNNLYVAGFIASIAGLKVVKTMHSIFRHRKFTYPYGFFIRLLSRKFFHFKFHSIGESVQENELNYYHNPSVRIYNWYDSKRFYEPNEQEKSQSRSKLGISHNQFVVVSVGSCSKNKNHSDIINALSLIKDELDFVYLHLGTGATESEEKHLVDSLGMREKVRFLGNQHNVRDYLIASDVFVMTSRIEGLGNAGIEAMACGLPSILYNSSGLKDLVRDNKNGILIQFDFRELASKLIYIKNNPDKAKQISLEAVSYVKSEFSISKNVAQMIQLYKGEDVGQIV